MESTFKGLSIMIWLKGQAFFIAGMAIQSREYGNTII